MPCSGIHITIILYKDDGGLSIYRGIHSDLIFTNDSRNLITRVWESGKQALSGGVIEGKPIARKKLETNFFK